MKQRVSQSFFRSAVMSSYNHHCCISGITLPSLLEACHIVAWSDDKLNRTNPKNGLCMNSFFHKAYDKHLLGISPDMKIVISEKLRTASCEQSFASYISNLNGKKILLPDKFLPQRELLAFRYDNFTKTPIRRIILCLIRCFLCTSGTKCNLHPTLSTLCGGSVFGVSEEHGIT
ncbi:MAG: HNH endonuclease [Candidatus Onthomorpha sp.]|nr:HNH endonuclease [Candidatus Onthomorpha sp.]